ncbi:MAG: ABC transporter substrate-binding protein [Desulfobacterales bacterium]
MKKKSFLYLAIAFLLLFPVSCTQSRDTEPGADQVPGVTDTEIRIGSSLALGGHAGYLGTQTLNGAMSYIRHVNEQGGIHGRKIDIIAYDDQYDPPRCVYNTQKLIVTDQVFALFCYVGTPTTVKIIPLVEEARIPLVGMFTGANELRKPGQRYLINVRASYYQETAASVKYLVEKLGLKKIAVFYQYDAFGFEGLKGTELALKKYSLVPVANGTYTRGTIAIEEGFEKIKGAQAEAVVMIGTYDPCAEFIRMCRSENFNPVFCSVSFVGAEELVQKLGKDGDGVIITQVVPSPQLPEIREKLWGVREYCKLQARYDPDNPPSFVGLEGYLNARVLVEGLKRAGRDLNREKFIDAIESIQNYDLGIENTLYFSPEDHQGLERVYYTRIQDGKIQLMTE